MWRTPTTESRYSFYRIGWVNPESERTTEIKFPPWVRFELTTSSSTVQRVTTELSPLSVHRPDTKFYNWVIRQAKVVCRRSVKLWLRKEHCLLRHNMSSHISALSIQVLRTHLLASEARRAVNNLIQKAVRVLKRVFKVMNNILSLHLSSFFVANKRFNIALPDNLMTFMLSHIAHVLDQQVFVFMV